MSAYHPKKAITSINDPAATTRQRLLVSGQARLEGGTGLVTLQRGMPVRSEDGLETGCVAAVVLDLPGQEITSFLFGFVPPTAVYHLVPLALIDKIEEEKVWLRITNEALAALPKHQPGS